MAIGKQSNISWRISVRGEKDGRKGSTLDEYKQRQKERGEEKRSRESVGREIDKENERGWAMVVGRAVGATYYREIKGSNSSRDFY